MAATAQAQTPAKATRQGIKALATPSVTARGAVSYIPKGGPSRLPPNALEKQAQRALTTPNRNWLTRKVRDYKAWQLKRQRRLRDAQALKLAQQAQELQARRAALPQLQPEQAYEIDDFTPFVTKELPTAPIPLLEEPGVLYRGLALPTDGIAVKNILANGLLLKDLGNHATTKLLSISGGTRGAVSAIRPVTNLTSLPEDAIYWATQHKTPGHDLWAVVTVDGIPQSGKIVIYSEDIPADQIVHVLIPLQLKAIPTWCDVSLTQDGHFLVIPYQPIP